MNEFFNSKGGQAYLFMTGGMWLVALSMVNSGAARPENPAWGLISCIRWALSAPIILAAIIGIMFWFGDRETERSNSEKKPDTIAAPKPIEVLLGTRNEIELEIQTSAPVTTAVAAAPFKMPEPLPEIEIQNPAQSPDEAVATALEEFL